MLWNFSFVFVVTENSWPLGSCVGSTILGPETESIKTVGVLVNAVEPDVVCGLNNGGNPRAAL